MTFAHRGSTTFAPSLTAGSGERGVLLCCLHQSDAPWHHAPTRDKAAEKKEKKQNRRERSQIVCLLNSPSVTSLTSEEGLRKALASVITSTENSLNGRATLQSKRRWSMRVTVWTQCPLNIFEETTKRNGDERVSIWSKEECGEGSGDTYQITSKPAYFQIHPKRNDAVCCLVCYRTRKGDLGGTLKSYLVNEELSVQGTCQNKQTYAAKHKAKLQGGLSVAVSFQPRPLDSPHFTISLEAEDRDRKRNMYSGTQYSHRRSNRTAVLICQLIAFVTS
ncbi:hypothetical protein BaRGS_00012682 [Batillaria attramentaria]|uniref:Uncharacterized protein n=1 Tax=Batillaria attramentaria TaxID=370345 RepID=A0ABD0L9L4_9CAEN